MIFFDYYFKAYATPKFLEPVAMCMNRRYRTLMADKDALQKFVAEIESELNAIPKAKGRYELYSDADDNGGYLYIYAKTKLGFVEGVIRLQYMEVLSFEGFSDDLCKRLNEVIEKGGEK